MIRLHGYWRSTASYRVRIALALKGVAHLDTPHDLRIGAQRAPDYLARNGQGLVPTLDTEDGPLTQSLAILEWLEECYPDPRLLPETAFDRGIVRSMAAIVCCDIHPLNNLRVLQELRSGLGADEDQVQAWMGRWIDEGFVALERLIERFGGTFAFGDSPGLADCCLVPQVYSAERFGVDLSPFPAIRAITGRCNDLPAFIRAHPSGQPDADA